MYPLAELEDNQGMTKKYRRNHKKHPLPYFGRKFVMRAAGRRSLGGHVKTSNGMWISSFLILLVFLAGLGWYVMAVSATVGEDYKLTKIEKRIEGLKFEHQDLMVRMSQEKTLDKIAERALGLGLVPAGRVAYIALPSSSLASISGLNAGQ